METMDIRWQKRLQNFSKALARLNTAAEILAQHIDRGTEINELMQEGLIQRFEYTHELAWNVMKDYAAYQGNTEIRGSRDAIRYALQTGLVNDRAWMKSIEDRNLSSHDYDQATADAIMAKILETYLPLFIEFEQVMTDIKQQEQ